MSSLINAVLAVCLHRVSSSVADRTICKQCGADCGPRDPELWGAEDDCGPDELTDEEFFERECA
jgi:hypothetical protein